MHNDTKVVDRAVDSAISQEHVSEVVIVDDGSDDDKAIDVDAFGGNRVKLISQTHQGPSAARNAGAHAATASHLVFLDADDVLLNGAIDRFHELHQGGHRLVRSGAVCGSETRLAVDGVGWHPRGCPLAGSFSIERALFLELGAYDTELRFGENTELLMRAYLTLVTSRDSIGYLHQPTVRISEHTDRPPDFYDSRRIHSIERILRTYDRELRSSPADLAIYLALAANLYASRGDRIAAIRHGWLRTRVQPRSLRAWMQLVRLALKPQRRFVPEPVGTST